MIQKNLKSKKSYIISFLIIFLLFVIPLPFYIEKEGGMIATKDRIDIENAFQSEGQFYMTYVSEIKVNIPLYIISLFNNKWDLIEKKEVILTNETEKDANFRSKLMLDESIHNAIISAYSLANKKIEINKEECYVTYIDELAKTDLKIQDKIIKINDNEIKYKKDIYKIIQNLNIGDTIHLQVERNNQILNREATLIELEDKPFIGIMITSKKEIKTEPNINIQFEKGESGSSGGLMMALDIYNSLIEEDITKGLKIAGTGTIDENGDIGEISGIKHKIRGAANEADIFLAPAGKNYEEALEVIKNDNLDIKLIEVSTLKEAIEKIKKEG